MTDTTEQLIEYYHLKIQQAEKDYQESIERVEKLQISQDEHCKQSYQIISKTNEVYQLQSALADLQQSLLVERKHTLDIMAENEKLRIQSLKDGKKIDFLLNLGQSKHSGVTFFKDKIGTRFIKVQKSKLEASTDLILFDDELEKQKLLEISLQAEITRLRDNHAEILAESDKQLGHYRQQLDRLKDTDEIRDQECVEKVHKLRKLLSENAKEHWALKKVHFEFETRSIKEKADLLSRIESLTAELDKVQAQYQQIEQFLENKIAKAFAKQIGEQQKTIDKQTINIDFLKHKHEKDFQSLEKKVQHYKSQRELAENRYNALFKRRGYDIEGFTTDIAILRKKLISLEKTIQRNNAAAVAYELSLDAKQHQINLGSELKDLKNRIRELEGELQHSVY